MNYIYQFTVPVFQKGLKSLENILDKAEAHAKAKGMDEGALLEERLASDMFPLKRQIQIACDNAKGVTARLSGAEPPVHEDNEMTIADLRARIAKTRDYIASVPESAFEGAETRRVTLPYFPGKFLNGFDYAREYALPNFLFHVVTAYAIVRKLGAEIGKAEYIAGLPLQDV
jgi:uncharacterized protein